ncbi:hypothetical protein TNCV_2650311 [Trichonephila clavipes]|nr:hypothetical protein TNCV_2650311 [Trichonephila clavipes]
MPNTPSSMPEVCTSSSSTQAHLLPSTSSVIRTIQSQSRLSIPISTTTNTTLDISLNTSASSFNHQFPYQSLPLLYPISGAHKEGVLGVRTLYPQGPWFFFPTDYNSKYIIVRKI